jgi:hypothetical protein
MCLNIVLVFRHVEKDGDEHYQIRKISQELDGEKIKMGAGGCLLSACFLPESAL